MSNVSDALEVEVAAIRAIGLKSAGRQPRPRERALIDWHFERLIRLIAPRIRYFTRAYGLTRFAEDAGQACAIAAHRAIEAYDPAKARFTTFVNWQLRGELQSLRFRLTRGQREEALPLEDMPPASIEDEDALDRVEALAADIMARRACGRLLDDHYGSLRQLAIRQGERRAQPRGREAIKPGTVDPAKLERLEAKLCRERTVVLAHLLGEEGDMPGDGLCGEQRRQIARRTIRALSARARGNPRFDPDALLLESPSLSRH